jgi:RNA polymerase sigma-70 factor (ECF subfamily)
VARPLALALLLVPTARGLRPPPIAVGEGALPGGGGPAPGLDALVECARAGDRRAFARVTERLAPHLVRYVRGYLRGDVDAAHDVVQDTFLTAWAKLHTLREASHLKPWLYRVARCKAITVLRRRGPQGTPFDSLEDVRARGRPLPEARATNPASAGGAALRLPGGLEALREAIDRLPPNYAGAVRLHYLHGCDMQETADLLGVPRTAVKMRLYRARRLLRRMLGPSAG